MSKIEWTDMTWNWIVGCSHHVAGCDNCYAATMAARQEGMQNGAKLAGTRPQYEGVTAPHVKLKKRHFSGRVNAAPEHIWNIPTKQKKPLTIFANSMSDAFHENVNDDWLVRAWSIMNSTIHDYQVLTKRPNRARRKIKELGLRMSDNIWLGVSICEDRHAKANVRDLLACGAAVSFGSAEPLLEALPSLDVTALDWVIAGGESGNAGQALREPRADWFRDLRDRCAIAGTPFFFKQWGHRVENGKRLTKEVAGHLLDGERIWQMPARVIDAISNPNPGWTRIAPIVPASPSKWHSVEDFRIDLAITHEREEAPPRHREASPRISLREPIWRVLQAHGPATGADLRMRVLAHEGLDEASPRIVNYHAWALVDLQRNGFVEKDKVTGKYRATKPRIRYRPDAGAV